MSWFEAFMISLLVFGIGGGFLYVVIHGVMLACEAEQKTISITDTIIIVSLIIGAFLFVPVVQYGGRNVDKADNYTPKKEYSNDSDWGDYDYDDDGKINQGEWEDALGDYMDGVMP